MYSGKFDVLISINIEFKSMVGAQVYFFLVYMENRLTPSPPLRIPQTSSITRRNLSVSSEG